MKNQETKLYNNEDNTLEDNTPIKKGNAIKIGVVGCGAVGNACTYAMLNQHLANEYVLIDLNTEVVRGTANDMQDTRWLLDNSFTKVSNGTYSDLKNADIVIISAGKPPSENQHRLEMVTDSVTIMKDVATQIKKSGFKGISIIVSNPVDIITSVYQKITDFPVNKVFGTGTTLDTSRLNNQIAKGLKLNTSQIKSYIIGEHGDSSVPVWTQTKVKGQPIFGYLLEHNINSICLDNFHSDSIKWAYEIVKDKGNTCYGIGASVAYLVKQIVNDTNKEVLISSQISGEYDPKFRDFYISVPTVLNRQGWKKANLLKLDDEELLKFNTSCQLVLDVLKEAY